MSEQSLDEYAYTIFAFHNYSLQEKLKNSIESQVTPNQSLAAENLDST